MLTHLKATGQWKYAGLAIERSLLYFGGEYGQAWCHFNEVVFLTGIQLTQVGRRFTNRPISYVRKHKCIICIALSQPVVSNAFSGDALNRTEKRAFCMQRAGAEHRRTDYPHTNRQTLRFTRLLSSSRRSSRVAAPQSSSRLRSGSTTEPATKSSDWGGVGDPPPSMTEAAAIRRFSLARCLPPRLRRLKALSRSWSSWSSRGRGVFPLPLKRRWWTRRRWAARALLTSVMKLPPSSGHCHGTASLEPSQTQTTVPSVRRQE